MYHIVRGVSKGKAVLRAGIVTLAAGSALGTDRVWGWEVARVERVWHKRHCRDTAKQR